MQAVSAKRKGRLPEAIRFMAPRLSLPAVGVVHARFPCARRFGVHRAGDFLSRHIRAVVLDFAVGRLGAFQVAFDVPYGRGLRGRQRRRPRSFTDGEIDVALGDRTAVGGRRVATACEGDMRRAQGDRDP